MFLTADAAPLVSAVAGIAGVIVGLSGDVLRRHWQRPKLRLLPFRAEAGDGVYFDGVYFENETRGAAWLRLGVRNEGRDAARDVEVHIEDIALADAAVDAVRREKFQRQQLTLLVGRRLKWADRVEPRLDIPRGTVRRVDIAHIAAAEPTYAAEHGLAVPIRFALDRSPSRSQRHVVAGLKYDVRLSLSGANCQTAVFDVRLEFGGHWLGHASVDPQAPGSLRAVRVSRHRGPPTLA